MTPILPDIRQVLGEIRSFYTVSSLAVAGLAVGFLVLLLAFLSGTSTTAFWAFFALGAFLLLGTAAAIVATAILRPTLLRSEKEVLMQTAFGILGDDKIGEIGRERVERTIGRYLNDPTADAVTRKRMPSVESRRDDGADHG